MTVNNSSNINKTNYNMSPQIIMNTKSTTTYDVRNADPALGSAQICGGVKLVYCNPTVPTWILITDI
jgi:hypothetical protein